MFNFFLHETGAELIWALVSFDPWEILLSGAQREYCHEKWQLRYAPSRTNAHVQQFTNTVTHGDPHLSPRSRLRLIGVFTPADAAGAVWGHADAYWLDCLCTIIETAGLNAEQICRPAAIQQHVFIIFQSLHWSGDPQSRFSSPLVFIYLFIYYLFL